MFTALSNNLFNAAPPGLDLARQVDTAGNRRIRRTGHVLAHQRFDRPGLRQRTNIRHIQLVVVHANLNWDTAGIVLMNECIENQLAQPFLGKRELFNPLLAILIPDLRLELLEVYKLQRSRRLFKLRTMYVVMIKQVRIVNAEHADLDIRTRNPLLGPFGEKKRGGK